MNKIIKITIFFYILLQIETYHPLKNLKKGKQHTSNIFSTSAKMKIVKKYYESPSHGK